MPGPPRTRKEPLRAKNGRMYPHPDNTANMQHWRAIWMAQGSPVLEPPVVLEVYIRVARPAYHFARRTGELSKDGRLYPYPPTFDCSNVIKLVEDALKNHAFGDDSEIVAIHCYKRWVPEGKSGTFVSCVTSGAYLEPKA